MAPLFPMDSRKNGSSSLGAITNGHARVLIIDDDHCIRNIFEDMLKSFGIHTRAFENPLDALVHVEEDFYNVILLDIAMPQISGLELLPKMKAASPASKFIMVTGCANKENAIQAFRYGDFDFLEKPVGIELMSHAIERASRVQQTEFRLMETLDQLEKTNARLTVQKNNEEHMQQWLVETNRALSTLAQNLENTRLESEKQVAETTRKRILPIVTKLCQDVVVFSRYPNQLGFLVQYIEGMAHNLASDQKIAVLLSQAELQVASLIRTGMSTQEIAQHLNVSPYTVKTHRRNIRKKLRIRNSKYNLKSYLTKESTRPKSALTLKD
ncbi:MAG: response regulator [Deltaproteobacteria bacterium]|nr:response regulator [Deltaproteobacteria bacterium]